MAHIHINDSKWKDSNPNFFIYSFHNNYHSVDNLDLAESPKVNHCTPLLNEQSFIIFVVLQGSLHIRVNGEVIKVKSHDFLLFMPYTTMEILDSQALFFSYALTSYIAADLYSKLGTPSIFPYNSYFFYHYHLSTQQINLLLKDYLRVKKIMINEMPILQEETLRSAIGIYLSHALSFLTKTEIINYKDTDESKILFNKFLELLQLHYNENRFVDYYAKLLNVQSKQLSAVSRKYAKKTASHVINDYVIYRIKIVLYNNQLTIKEISDMFNFPTQSFFGRYFKRVTGHSPSKYVSLYSKKLLKQ